jgi:hypothetical protein
MNKDNRIIRYHLITALSFAILLAVNNPRTMIAMAVMVVIHGIAIVCGAFYYKSTNMNSTKTILISGIIIYIVSEIITFGVIPREGLFFFVVQSNKDTVVVSGIILIVSLLGSALQYLDTKFIWKE